MEDAREIRRPAPRTEHRANRVDEVIRGGEGSAFAPSHDLASDPGGTRLIGVRAQQGGEIDFVDGIEQLVGPDIGVAAHAHVEWSALAEGEAAGVIVELMRRHAEIEQDPIEALGGGEASAFEIGIVAKERTELTSAFVLTEAIARRGEGARIAIDAGHAHTALEERSRVTAATEGAVEDTRGAVEQRLDLGEQHGDVVGAHAPGGGSSDRAHAYLLTLAGDSGRSC